jgi:hypothetical protein
VLYKRMKKTSYLLFALIFTAAPAFALEGMAERYVKLSLELGQYDPDYVDAYLGPPEWAEDAKLKPRSKVDLAAAISGLLTELNQFSPTEDEQVRRHQALYRNVRAMDARIRMSLSETFSFAEEARLIYDVELPRYDFSEFDHALEEIAILFPGDGDLAERVDSFRDSLAIPEEHRDAVVDRAISECRKRTAEHISLPDSEGFNLEYVTGKSWSGYNWYQGENISLMMLNVDFPVKISSVVGLGCHEGYPGHHVWNVLVENQLLKKKGWVEFSVFPLFSPYALIGEGSANYGVHLAFPDNEKIVFEREVLFPLARIDPGKAIILEKLDELTKQLSHAVTATAQLYLDGDISREEAIEQRRKYGLSSPERAEQSVRFIEQYRSYVLNYNLGQDIVKAYIESQSNDPKSRWDAFERLLTELLSASDIATISP